MSSGITLRTPADNVLDIVNKTKILVDRLRLAIFHQENLTKDCVDTTATELSKTVEGIKKRYDILNEEFESVEEEVKAGELRLNNLLEEYDEVLKENASLKETENDILNQKGVVEEHMKKAEALRELLRVYKLLTGVRFDFDTTQKVLTGYVGISGDEPSNTTFVPFEFDKENFNTKQLLWDKINEACSEISEF